MSREAHPEQSKVSVVVPLYNVEEFLPRCLESIAKQTLASMEIILVDDASTDNSFAVASEYARGRENWLVCKNEVNLGLSATRNHGISIATGDFIGFVDSDDWVEPTMFEALLKAAESTNSDIAQVQYATDSRQNGSIRQPEERIRVVSGPAALEEMLLTEKYAVWFMLYRRNLFAEGEEWFPAGLTCEDRVANSQLLPRAERVAVSNQIGYHYFLNPGSISYSGLDKRGLDLLKADKLMVSRVEQIGDARLLALAQGRAAKGPFSLLVKWARFGTTDTALNENEVLPMLWREFRSNYRTLMKSPLPASKKIVAWQLKHCPKLLRLEFSLYNKLSRRKGARS